MLMLQLVAMIVEFLKSGGAHVGQDLRVVLEEVSSAVKEERRVVCRGRAGDPGYTWGDEMCLLSSRVRGLLYEAKLDEGGGSLLVLLLATRWWVYSLFQVRLLGWLLFSCRVFLRVVCFGGVRCTIG